MNWLNYMLELVGKCLYWLENVCGSRLLVRTGIGWEGYDILLGMWHWFRRHTYMDISNICSSMKSGGVNSQYNEVAVVCNCILLDVVYIRVSL